MISSLNPEKPEAIMRGHTTDGHVAGVGAGQNPPVHSSAHAHGKSGSSGWLFHPFELAVCGYKNSGKTTLLEALTRRMSKELDLGYMKHDVHGFEMDREGKDTYRLTIAGARTVAIGTETKSASIRTHSTGSTGISPLSAYTFLECDALFVEGYKASGLPRIMLLDEKGAILDDPAWTEANPVAVVGPWHAGKSSSSVLNDAMQRFPDLPYFCRDDIDTLSAWITGFWYGKHVPVYGLVLSGGRSTRMGRDKAELNYGGHPALDYAESLLTPYCQDVFVSCRQDQETLRNRPGRKLITDRFLDCGPLGGILSALFHKPEAAWLVIACDMPLLEPGTIRMLLEGRDPFRFATSYRGNRDLPEPLCTIYEPKSRLRFMQYLGAGVDCPRKMLCGNRIRLLDPPSEHELENANEPADYERILHDKALGRR